MTLKALALAILAGIYAASAVVINDTPARFQRGQARRGTPTADAHFIGQTWPCGDEECFAGLVIDTEPPYWHTGP